MLKLYINESAYIKEDIEAVKKYYPNIEDDMFMNLIALDPTYRDGSNSVGKYGKWILNLYNKGNLSEDDFNNITDVLNQFTTYRNRIQNKDLNSYKSLSALEDVLATVVDDDSMLTDRQKLRFLKNVKASKVKTDKEDDYDTVLDTPKFIVYVPNTHEASMKLGKGTEWCTAHENPEWYDKYTEDHGKLYIIKDKKTGERWQYSDSTTDFLDENDESFDIPELMRQDEKLSKFFEKFLGIDYFNFDGTCTYDGKNISNNLKSVVTEITISDSVTEIRHDAFANCKLLTAITIPDSVVEIEYGAFKNCTSLTSITVPDSVTKIGWEAFIYCTSLTSITIPDDITEIEDFTFGGCTSLTSITIPDSVTEIGSSAFAFCTSLTSITIPDSVTEIGSSAFENCKSLTSITIPDSVTEIGSSAFVGCTSLTSIVIPDGVDEISRLTFSGCTSLTSVTMPNTVTEIRDYAFEFCKSLTSITIPNDVTYIGDFAFEHCASLTSVIIPDAVTEIGDFAFAHCSALTSITVPDSVAYIGDSTFDDCNKSLIIYTNNEYVINYCNENNIPVKPISQKESYKLHIKEY